MFSLMAFLNTNVVYSWKKIKNAVLSFKQCNSIVVDPALTIKSATYCISSHEIKTLFYYVFVHTLEMHKEAIAQR